VCSGCRTHEEQKRVDWDQREQLFRELCDDYRSPDGSNYDCLIPVSGGINVMSGPNIFERALS
jgi:hypothetical protein